MEIGKRIKKIRTEKALKQDEFGTLLGTNRSVIGRIETGRQMIDQDFLYKIWTVLNVSPHWVITGEDLGSAQENSKLRKELDHTKSMLAVVKSDRDTKASFIRLLEKTAGIT